MNASIQLYDVVALTEDLAAGNLVRGQVGTVVMVHSPDDFEVEFSDNDGHTYALLTLKSRQLMVLRHQPAAT